MFLLVNTSFSIFSEMLRFFKVEVTFRYSGNTFFYKSFIWLVETMLFDQSYFSTSGSHYWNQGGEGEGGTVFKERPNYCQWTTNCLASGNHFFLYFSETLASDSFSCRMKDSINRITFSLCQKTASTGRNPIVGERLLFQKWLHLNLNNGFHMHKILL